MKPPYKKYQAVRAVKGGQDHYAQELLAVWPGLFRILGASLVISAIVVAVKVATHH